MAEQKKKSALDQQLEATERRLAELRKRKRKEETERYARLGRIVEKVFGDELVSDESAWEMQLMTILDAAKRMRNVKA